MKVSPPDPVIISWSGLKRWENCPQHQLRLIEGKTKQSDKGRIFLPGTVCDLVQRRWLDSANPEPGQMPALVDQIFDETVEKGESRIHWKGNPLEDQKNVRAFCKETVTKLEPWLVQNVLPYDYDVEHKFGVFMEIPYICDGGKAPLKMIGGIDLIVRDDQGKFRLYDLKITKDPGYIRSTLAQLIFYNLAWSVANEDWNACNEWGFVTPALPDEMLIPIDVTVEDTKNMLSRIVAYAQGSWAGQWDPKSDDTGCTWCDARAVCDKFKVVTIVESNGRQRVSFDDAVARRRAART